jgi:hypothetical protein
MKLLLALFLATAACSPLSQGEDSGDKRPTLLIVNSGFENLRVIDEFGRTLARVFRGDSACIVLLRDALQQFFVQQPYKTEAAPIFSPYGREGWRIEIGNTLVFDVLSLQPAERCK